MKKLLLLLTLLSFSIATKAQIINLTTQRVRTFVTTAADNTISLKGVSTYQHRILWQTTGTVSTCSVKLEQSSDNSSWSDLITAQTCTANGRSIFFTGTNNYVRINLTTLTGGGSLVVIYQGFSDPPSVAAGAGPPGGNPGDIQFNDAGVFGGTPFSWNAGTKTLSNTTNNFSLDFVQGSESNEFFLSAADAANGGTTTTDVSAGNNIVSFNGIANSIGTGGVATGGQFSVQADDNTDKTFLRALTARIESSATSGTISEASGLYVGMPSSGGATYTSLSGVHITDQTGVNTLPGIGLLVDDHGTGKAIKVAGGLSEFDGPIGVGGTQCKALSGTGSPEGVATAGVCSIFLRTNGASATTFYVKESGVGNTGWVPFGANGTVSTMPITIASDDFVRPDESPLKDSGNWSLAAGPGTQGSPLKLVSNLVQASSSVGGNNSNTAWWSGNTFSSNQWAQVSVEALAHEASNGGIILRYQPKTNADCLTGYTGQVLGTTGGLGSATVTLLISAIVGCSESNLATTTAQVNASDIIRFEANGPSLTLKLNGVTKLTAIDGNIYGGSPAIHTFILSGSSIANVKLGNFSAGNLSGDPVNTTAYDNFTRPDETPLSGQSRWTVENPPNATGLNLVSNTLRAPAASAGYMVYTAQVFPENQCSQVSITTLASNSDFISPLVHTWPGVQNGYFARIPGGPLPASVSALILRARAGAFATLATIPATTVTSGDVFKVCAVNTPFSGAGVAAVNITVYQNGQPMIGGQVTEAITSVSGPGVMTGNPGVYVQNNAAAANAVADNFQTSDPPVASTAINTVTVCNVNGVSPAACGSAVSGSVVVPTTTTTYTVNSTAVTDSSKVILTPRTDATGLAGAPTCVAPPIPFIAYISGRTTGTSFTFTLPLTTGTSCWDFLLVN